jgi:ATP-dependent Clp protease ATP-binding subunit ClpA
VDVDPDRVPQPLRPIVLSAIEEAGRRSCSEVRPEHLLLALTADPESAAGGILGDAGLDHARLDAALDQERAAALAVLGIQDLDPALLSATVRPGRLSWASATREVFRRWQTTGGRGRRRPMDLDVLYGIVTANMGTVPRALEYAGIDRDALIGRVERERISADGEPSRGVRPGVSAHERQAMRRETQRRAEQKASFEAPRAPHEDRSHSEGEGEDA